MTEQTKISSINDFLVQIKKDFFVYRNGIVADALKKIYPQDKLIYGLTVPQFMEIAKKYPKDLTLALKLWEDKKTRESRLLALYLLPTDELDMEGAKNMILDVESTEEAEFLAFRVLKKLPFSENLLKEMENQNLEEKNLQYCLEMFKKNLMV